MVYYRILICILSISVEHLEMSYAEAIDAQDPWAGDLKAEDFLSLLSLMCLQEVKFFLNPVLPLCHLLGSLARLSLMGFP